MSDDLKPCPFCGWDAPYVRTAGIETEVYCQNCTAFGPLVHCNDCFLELWDAALAELEGRND
jgi:hypothetical protein